MRIDLPYNRKTVTVEIPDKNLGAILEMKEPVRIPGRNAVDMVKKATKGTLDDFLALPGSTLVIVNDGTRPTPTRIVLDAIGDRLEKAGASFIIATGSHREPTREEYGFIFGSNRKLNRAQNLHSV